MHTIFPSSIIFIDSNYVLVCLDSRQLSEAFEGFSRLDDFRPMLLDCSSKD